MEARLLGVHSDPILRLGRALSVILAAVALLGCPPTKQFVDGDRSAEPSFQCSPGPARVLDIPAPTVDRLVVLETLRAAQFDQLERRLAALSAAAADDPRLETDLALAVSALSTGETSSTAPIEAWVAERPSSAWAHTAKALHLNAQAWRARGTDWAQDTEESKVQKMRIAQARALESAETALALRLHPERASLGRQLRGHGGL